MHSLRNLSVLTVGTAFYMLVLHVSFDSLVFLVGAPLVIGILGYEVARGPSLVRRVVPSLVPIVAWPFAYALSSQSVHWMYFVLHSMAVGIVVVQFWELMLWLHRLVGREKGASA